MTKTRTIRRALVLLLVVVAAYRLTLLDRGAMALVDEQMYYISGLALEKLSGGDLRGALRDIGGTNGRPGAALVRLPIAALQGIPYAFGVAPSNPRSLLIPTVANVIVSLATLYLFFEICLALCGDAGAALTASIVYALLVNTNMYVRHLLPYDWALCVAACGLWLAIVRRGTLRTAAAVGALSATAVTIYPGYYLLAVIPGVAIVGLDGFGVLKRAASRGAVFAASGAAVIVAIELICRAGGTSYLESAQTLSRTLEGRAMEEGWTFLPGYLVQIERLSGIALLIGTVVYLWRAAARLGARSFRPIDWLVLPALAGCVWQAADSSHWHGTLLYGRLIHPWMLFMSLALADTIAALDPRPLRIAACSAALICAAVSWAPAARAYYRLAYPADVLYALRIDTERIPSNGIRCEFEPATFYHSPGPLNRETRYPYTDAAPPDGLLLNFCQGAPTPAARAAATDLPDDSLVFEGPHFLSFPAYGFEGFSPQAREALVHGDYRVRVWARRPR